MIVVGETVRTLDSVSARVEMEGGCHQLTYRFPGGEFAGGADGLLAATLLPAMREGGKVQLEGELSHRLADASATIQDIILTWDRYAWRSGLRRVDVKAKYRARWPKPRPGGVGCFFTGGVDSSYTAIKHRSEITHLVFVHGFDIALERTGLRAEVSATLARAAATLGKPLLEIETDLRSFSDPLFPWPDYHGAALASVALLLSSVLHKVYVPASYHYAMLQPWGSHPVLDPLWSTERVSIVHDGAEASRGDKVATFAGNPLPLNWLRVCWANPGDAYNCGHCEKCLRTMMLLRLAGVLDTCSTFPSGLNLDLLAQAEGIERPVWEQYARMIEERGSDPPLAQAMRAALARDHQ